MSDWITGWRKRRTQDEKDLPELSIPAVDPLFAADTPLAPALYRLEAEGQSKSRRNHAQHVATYMIHLAVCHHEDPVRFAQAGLLHDLAKERPTKEQAHLARLDEDCPPALSSGTLHGPAAVTLIRMGGPEVDEEVLDAIRLHTIAGPNMSPVGMALYLADKIELTRSFKDLNGIREQAKISLEDGMALCLQEVVDSLGKDNENGHPWTWKAIEFYCDLD